MQRVQPPYLMPVYNRLDVAFTHGEGAYLFATNGRRYLDFMSGIAVNALGHAHPHLTGQLQAQVNKLLHISNFARVPEQERLARRLCEASFADAVYFANSGAEAVEGAIKMARRTHHAEGDPGRNRIITLKTAFHGRTLGALAATGNAKYLEGFAPNLGGFDQVDASLDALAAAIGPQTAAVMLEPVIAEGGVKDLPPDFLRGVRDICDQHGALMICDEVQTGIGRTGDFFGYQASGVAPDIMTMAKALGGGVPVGAIATTQRVADHMQPGTHGSTYSGNPLAMAAGNAVLDVVLAPGFLDHVRARGQQLRRLGADLVNDLPDVFTEVRGRGLLFGVKCKVPNSDLVAACFEKDLIVHIAGDNVLRLLPPLIVTEKQIDSAMTTIRAAASDLQNTSKAA